MRKLGRLGALSLFWLACASCEEDRAVDVGTLEVTPGALAFGAVDVGLSRAIRVSVLNPSLAAVGVPAISATGDPDHELGLSDLFTTDCKDAPRAASSTLGPGECARFTATWTPSGPHAAQGAVELASSDSNDPIILPVSGLGLSTAFPALRACVLDASGAVVDAACSNLGADPPLIPTVDFGNGVPDTSVSRTVRLFNDGQAPLVFSAQPALPITTPTQFSLSGEVPAGQLAPGASADLILTATPVALGTLTGELDLGTNDPREMFVAVPLQIATTGIAICVAPAVELPFGLVLIGTSPEESFALTNCGPGDVSFESTAFAPIAPTTTQFTLSSGAAPTPGIVLHPNDQLMSSVTYTPTVAESDLAGLEVQFANSYGIYTSRVGLSGSAVTTFCGTAMEPVPTANIAASYSTSAGAGFVPFDPNATPSPVAPLDYVQFSGAASTGANPATYTWKLVSQPAGSTTALTGGGAQVAMQTLVAGAYVVQLSVSDSSGCAGTSEVTVQVVPTGDVHLELLWAEDCGDLDLHYLGPGGPLCSDYDTAYYNLNPDWGCATAGCGHEEDPGGIYPDETRVDDAKLDHDDQWGFGPENITQASPFDSPASTPYQVWVYYFSATPDGGGGSGVCGIAHPTVNVYIGGALASTFTLSAGLAEFAAWHAADLAISNQGASVQVIPGDISSAYSAPCSANMGNGGGRGRKRAR